MGDQKTDCPIVKYLIYIILGIHLLFVSLSFDPKLCTGGDNAAYIILGRAILQGSYTNISHPDEPPHTKYPPGYPLLLAAVMRITGHNNIFSLKILSVLLSLGALYLFCLWAIRIYGTDQKIIGYGAAFLYAINPLILTFSHSCYSEIPFMFFLILTMFLFLRYEQRPNVSGLILATFAGVFCYYIRSAGITVIVAIPVYLLYKRRFKECGLFIGISALLIAPWMIRNHSIGNGGYLEEFLIRNPYDLGSGRIGIADLFVRLGKNLRIYGLQVVPMFIFSALHRSLMGGGVIFLSIIITGITLWGFVRDIIKGIKPIHFIFLFFVGLTLIWPSVWSSYRFLLPLFPFILIYFFKGVQDIVPCKKAKPRKQKITNYRLPVTDYRSLLIFSLIGIATFTSLSVTLKAIPENLNNLSSYLQGDKWAGYSEDWVNYYRTAEWIRMNTPEDAIVLCRKPFLFYLTSNRETFSYPMTHNEDEILGSIIRADYIIVDHFFWTATTRRFLLPVLKRNREWFTLVYATGQPQTLILRVKDELRQKSDQK